MPYWMRKSVFQSNFVLERSRKSMVTESSVDGWWPRSVISARRRVAPAVSVGVNHFQIALS